MSRLTRSQQGELTPAGDFSKRRQDGSRHGNKSQSVSSRIDVDKTFTDSRLINRSTSRSSSINVGHPPSQQGKLFEGYNLKEQGIGRDLSNPSLVHSQGFIETLEPGRHSFSNRELESNRDPKEQEERPQEKGFQQSGSIQSRARIQPRQQDKAQKPN